MFDLLTSSLNSDSPAEVIGAFVFVAFVIGSVFVALVCMTILFRDE